MQSNRDESTLIAGIIIKLAKYSISKHASEGEDVQNNSRLDSLEDSTKNTVDSVGVHDSE